MEFCVSFNAHTPLIIHVVVVFDYVDSCRAGLCVVVSQGYQYRMFRYIHLDCDAIYGIIRAMDALIITLYM